MFLEFLKVHVLQTQDYKPANLHTGVKCFPAYHLFGLKKCHMALRVITYWSKG